jgi:tetratricopeptide (TPR) repeat protein
MKPVALLGLLFGNAAASGCIWVSDVNLEGRKTEIGEEGVAFKREALTRGRGKMDWSARVKDLEARMADSPAVRDRADYGGVLLHLGEFAKAKEVLVEAERLHPGNYQVAANLGTAYELLGDNENALVWIRKGIERNRDSHYGTEWVHVKVLEAKLALAKDPNWLQSHSVLGEDFGSAPRPELKGVPRAEIREKAQRMVMAAGYQLRERLQFVKAPDPLVGDLLFDLANALALHGAVQTSEGVYTLAQEYGAPKAALLQQRVAFARQVIARAKK